MQKQRVRVINLEMNIVYACNLKCEYCTHLGRLMKGLVPFNDLLTWYKTWNSKIHPDNVRIMGGEPLLHPDLEKIIYETRAHWKSSCIELITNGLLLTKMKNDIFTAIKETETNVTISKHFDDPYYNRMLGKGIVALKYHGIMPQLSQSNKLWMKCYQINSEGVRKPYRSDPQKAWNICYVKNLCTTLLDNKLYRCPQLGCYSHARKMGWIDQGWETVLDYKPLTPECTRDELVDFITMGACDQCSICPEEFQYADMYEKVNLFGLSSFQKHFFCAENHE